MKSMNSKKLRNATVMGCLGLVILMLLLEAAASLLEGAVVFFGWNWVVSPLFHVGAIPSGDFWLVVGLIYLVNFALGVVRSAFSRAK